MLSGIAALTLFITAIFGADGSYTGNNLVTDNELECRSAVQYARKHPQIVAEGWYVADCTAVNLHPYVQRTPEIQGGE